MSADKSKLHVLVLPEDRANHEIANGFRGHEELKADQRLDFESIGRKLREDCPRKPDGIWGHGLLSHNSLEVERMWSAIGRILSGN